MVTKAPIFVVFFYRNVHVFHFFLYFLAYNKTKYLGHDLLQEIFEIIASREYSPPAIIRGNTCGMPVAMKRNVT